MVSNASDDLPDPLRPVITVKALRGISTLMFFRLCWRAPRTLIEVIAIPFCCGLPVGLSSWLAVTGISDLLFLS